MLLKQLSNDDKRLFLRVAELLSLSDKPILWGGKRKEEITSTTNLSDIKIQRGERETLALEDLHLALQVSEDKAEPAASGSWANLGNLGNLFQQVAAMAQGANSIEYSLLARIKKLPLQTADDPAARASAALEILRDQLKEKKSILPSVPKLMLFELMMLALTDGAVSSIEWQVLNEFKHHYQIEDHIFDDLLARAELTYREAQKTIAIILE
ncbi:conserved hypothetical protein [Paraburkholderia tropica]|uniref:hypothetical protein n=1 Tax=Paraburkholderia TaxID=1822464 RepID=UPI001CB3BF68|nr:MULTISPECIES: hypothetical protein [Paraburkholderia]CAG9227362.1 conserved hypothetical protein [Paraburkholderia tropica]